MNFNTHPFPQSSSNNPPGFGVAGVTPLQEMRDRLEQRVQERTLELIEANQQLQSEVNRRQRSEQVLLATRARLKRLVTFSPAVIYSRNLGEDYSITFVSDSIAQFGYDPQTLLADPGFWAKRIHPEDATQVCLDLVSLLQEGQQVCEYRILHREGHYCWIRDQRQVVLDDQNNPLEIIGSWQDISDLKQAEQALAREKDLAQTTLQSIADAVIATDAKGRVAYMNSAAVELTGWTMEEAWNMRLSEVFVTINESSRARVTPLIRQILQAGSPDNPLDQVILVAKNGMEYMIDESTAPIRDRDGKITGTVVVFRDVTKPRMLSRQLSWQATHDALTGLINRQEFEHRVSQSIETAQNHHQIHVLCYLDLDQFKVVNDTCGHIAGDELLRQVSALLGQALRSGDIVARLGGDEFGLLLISCPLPKALEITHKLLGMIQAFRFVWQDNVFKVGASIGLVVIDANSGDVNKVLSAADVACYAAKDNGRNRVHLYQSNDQEMAQQRCEQQWVARITHALDQGRYRLYKQLIVPLAADSTAEHVEILLRMVDDKGEIVPPMAFLPAAERYGLMTLLDQWVVTHFLAYLKTIQPLNLSDSSSHQSRYAINLSGASINDRQFLDFVKTTFASCPGLAQQICFEITETIAIANLSKAAQFMQELKQLGFQFALDDFGSGMSSFNYLKHLPVDYLKIDGSFVRNILNSPIDSAMVECINRLGHVAGIQTIAEFVDSQEILECLRELGVDYVQGYAISLPKPLED
jgi:diguanylate cyclase (GGDEF)-like protein/PAS domain S-box-containing protein